MNAGYVISIILVYFGLLYLVSRLTSGKSDASTFFIANRKAPWFLVAYGMIGVAISGITFISVPGQVIDMQFSYFQMVIGYVIGLLIVAYILLPVFYRIRAISIYSFLDQRFGKISHKTGAVLFIMAQTATASFKLFLMAYVLQIALFNTLGIPFWITVLVTLLLIWFYTYRGGIKTVIFTDTFQTTFLILALVLSIWTIASRLNYSVIELYSVMDMQGFSMQKHLTCKDLASSQKNIVTLAIILIVVNLLFLFLGGALAVFAISENIPMPEQTDNLYPILAVDHMGLIAGTFFLIGIAAAAYSSADSSLTGLTTSFCVDLLNFDEKDDHRRQLRYFIHLGFTLLIFVLIIIFKQVNNESVLYAFIRTSGFIYGPLLGLFIFGIYSKRKIKDKLIPYICILSPVISVILDLRSPHWFNGYEFGYDILLLNFILTLIALFILSKKKL
jgi:Na+/proline symporter